MYGGVGRRVSGVFTTSIIFDPSVTAPNTSATLGAENIVFDAHDYNSVYGGSDAVMPESSSVLCGIYLGHTA